MESCRRAAHNLLELTRAGIPSMHQYMTDGTENKDYIPPIVLNIWNGNSWMDKPVAIQLWGTKDREWNLIVLARPLTLWTITSSDGECFAELPNGSFIPVNWEHSLDLLTYGLKWNSRPNLDGTPNNDVSGLIWTQRWVQRVLPQIIQEIPWAEFSDIKDLTNKLNNSDWWNIVWSKGINGGYDRHVALEILLWNYVPKFKFQSSTNAPITLQDASPEEMKSIRLAALLTYRNFLSHAAILPENEEQMRELVLSKNWDLKEFLNEFPLPEINGKRLGLVLN